MKQRTDRHISSKATTEKRYNARMTTMKITSKDLIVYLLIGIVYYALICQYVGAEDDVMYSYLRAIADDEIYHYWSHPIKTLSDVIKSQLCDYKFWNGRITIHTVVQILCAFDWGKPVFFLVSSFSYVLLIIGIQKITFIIANEKTNALLITTLTLLLIPHIGKTYLGNISFVVNYLWTSTVSVWIIYFFLKLSGNYVENKISTSLFWGLIPLFLYGGSMHEGFSIPISFLFLVYCIKHVKDIDRRLLILILLYWIGSLIVITAPSNFIRFGKYNDSADTIGLFKQLIERAKSIFITVHQAAILAIIGISLITMHKRNKINYRSCLPFALIMICALSFDICIAYCGRQQLIPVCLIEVVILSVTLSKIKIHKYAYWLIGGLVAILIGTILYYRILWTNTWNKMHEDIASENKDYYEATDLYNMKQLTPTAIAPFTQARNALTPLWVSPFYVSLSSVIATNGKNPEKIKAILPAAKSEILNIVNNTPEVSPGIYTNGKYLILKVPQKHDNSVRIQYQYNQTFIGRLLCKYDLRQAITETYKPNPGNSFKDSDYIYYIVFIEHESLKNVTMCHD